MFLNTLTDQLEPTTCRRGIDYQEHDKCIEQRYWLFAFWV